MKNDSILFRLEPSDWLALNAKLQTKKNKLREELNSFGVLEKGGYNSFDRYRYFSEAQYKLLFTGLFSKYGLELTVDEQEYTMYEGSDKQPNGRTVRLMFTLTDCETGFSESSEITGEGMDKGDKGGYKAHTGALKYYLANTFMVATGDDAESESPVNTASKAAKTPYRAANHDDKGKQTNPKRARFLGLYKDCKGAGIPDDEIVSRVQDAIPGKESKDYTPEEQDTAIDVLLTLLKEWQE